MQRKILLIILFILIVIALMFKSPLAATYNYNTAKGLYDKGQYEKSLSHFERAYFASPKNSINRYAYAMALSKSRPTYSVQKKLYELSRYKPEDEAVRMAKSKASQMRYTLLSGIGNNYIYNASSGTDIIRWSTQSFPLKVYIEQSDVPQYYTSNIRSALRQWTDRTTFVKFSETKNESDAQIVIRFKNIDTTECSGNTCKYVVAYTEPIIGTGNTLKKMTLTFYKTDPKNKNFTSHEIYKTALHEIGHTLGIMGHSDSSEDIMYPSRNNMRLSERDLKTLVLLYRTKPTISDKQNISGEKLYYAPLVIGSSDVIASKKIDELTKYVKKYPNFAAGYINLGGAYADTGDFEKALQNMTTAEKYANSNDERYLIDYNRAIIYYNMQNPQSAMQYAKRAQSYKNDPAVNELIEEIKNQK